MRAAQAAADRANPLSPACAAAAGGAVPVPSGRPWGRCRMAGARARRRAGQGEGRASELSVFQVRQAVRTGPARCVVPARQAGKAGRERTGQ
ncbi:hypothetical protein [Komagataeibacter rhaeticus]|uniref:hypothetical protein n=1 Tax=Komagataeibacter rhaeticus TaxID=215221 RepID=UPI000DD3374A|nr:hypothetical protein [Komagataeibacter rhaeticus]